MTTTINFKPKIRVVITPTFHFQEDFELEEFNKEKIDRAIEDAKEKLRKGIEGRDLLTDVDIHLIWDSDKEFIYDTAGETWSHIDLT